MGICKYRFFRLKKGKEGAILYKMYNGKVAQSYFYGFPPHLAQRLNVFLHCLFGVPFLRNKNEVLL